MGRPRAKERLINVAASVPESQADMIHAHAQARGLTTSQMLRELLSRELGFVIETELDRNRRLRREAADQQEQLAVEAAAAIASAPRARRPKMIA